MKKNLIYIALFSAFLAVSCKSNDQKEDTTEKLSTNSEITIGIIDTDSIFAHYDMVIDVMGELESTEKKLTDDLQRQAQRFQTDYENYLKVGATLTLSEQRKREEQLGNRQQELQKLEQQYSQQLMALRLQKNQEIEEKLFGFFEEYNKAHHNFSLILSKARTSGVLYSLPSMDITKEVIEALNAEYAKKKK